MPPLTSNRAASRHYTDTGGAAELRAQGETLPAHIAPLGWEYISFNGVLGMAVRTAQTGVSALRNLRSAFLDAAIAAIEQPSGHLPRNASNQGWRAAGSLTTLP